MKQKLDKKSIKPDIFNEAPPTPAEPKVMWEPRNPAREEVPPIFEKPTVEK